MSQSAGVVDAYKHESPVVDTDAYMMWLRSLVASKGCQFVTKRVTGDLLEHEDHLLELFDAQLIINCTGLGGYELAADKTVYPLRGALIRVVNDGSKFPLVKEALVVAHDYNKRDEDGGIVFIVPRNDQTLILGGECLTVFTASRSCLLIPIFHAVLQASRNRTSTTLI